MSKRYNLSHPMHVRIMGKFLNLRKESGYTRAPTVKALQKHGLLDDKGLRTPACMDYIVGICNGRDARLQARYPDVPMVYNDFGVYQKFKQYCWFPDAEISVYVYAGSNPLLVLDGNGQQPLALLSTYYMWQIEVLDSATEDCKRIRKASTYQGIIGHKNSYSYKIDHDEFMTGWGTNITEAVES